MLRTAPPQAFSFKATIQGANGQTVVNKMIRLRISVLQDDMNGFTAYSEYFTPTTNHYSQVDVEIGRGNVLSGIFSSIDWSAHTYFLKVEVDAKGGTNYQLLSVTQLLSVPYALYAGNAGNAFSGNYSDLIGAPILAIVATTGNYNDLFDQPTLFSGDYNDLINLPPLFSGNYNDLSNKPTLFDGTWSSLTGKPSFSTVAISGSWNDLINKPTTLAGYGITDALSNSHPASVITAIDITNWNSAFSWGNHSGLYRPVSYVPAWSEIIDKPTFATVATSGSYNDLNNKPTIDGSEDAVTKAYADALMQRVEDLEGLLSGTNISDIDGNIYDVVTIGEQVWMADNLRTTRLNDGTPITLVNDLHEWNQNDGAYGRRAPMVCWYDYANSKQKYLWRFIQSILRRQEIYVQLAGMYHLLKNGRFS